MVYDPAKRKERYEKNKDREKEKKKEAGAKYYEKNKEKINTKKKEHYEENKEKKKEYYQKNKERDIERTIHRLEDLKQHACDSISTGSIIDRHKWDMWCNQIKCSARRNKQPYSVDFANVDMFERMLQGCFYCGSIATTIDRIDSKLEHTAENCVSSCHGCNISKSVADPSTFIKKAYYRTREKYYDNDSNIWFVYKRKPGFAQYKSNANKKRVPFDLTKEDWERLIKGDCAYCHRSPITWFGIDRVMPSLGYTLGNVVSCCFDCNLDKLEDDVDTMSSRNERIARRVDDGELIITECEKIILHKGREINL